MPYFILHFEAYYQAKKHPIGGHIALTYFLYTQLAGLAAMLAVALVGTLQDYAFRPSSPFHAWEPLGVAGFLRLFAEGELMLIPIWALVFMLPYRYIKRQMEGGHLEEVELRKAQKAQEKQARKEGKSRS